MVSALELRGVDDAAVVGGAVDVDVEDGEENADAADAAVEEFAFFDFLDVGDASIGGRDDEAGVLRNAAGRVAEEPETEKEQGAGQQRRPG